MKRVAIITLLVLLQGLTSGFPGESGYNNELYKIDDESVSNDVSEDKKILIEYLETLHHAHYLVKRVLEDIDQVEYRYSYGFITEDQLLRAYNMHLSILVHCKLNS